MNAATPLSRQHLYKAEPGTLIWSEPQPDGSSVVVKLYRRRALFDPLKRLFIAYRVEREYRLLRRLREQGIACPEPLAWSHGRSRSHGRFERLDTREIDGAVPLADLFPHADCPDIAPLFGLMRRMHAAGIAHGALYARNVLIAGPRNPAPEFYLIDLAHGRAFARDIAGSHPAEYDLLDLLASLGRLGPADAAASWLAAYGLEPDAAGALLGRSARYRSLRPWRHLRRIETDARAMLDSLRFAT